METDGQRDRYIDREQGREKRQNMEKSERIENRDVSRNKEMEIKDKEERGKLNNYELQLKIQQDKYFRAKDRDNEQGNEEKEN